MNQMVASKILASLGCTFEIVDNGRLAVQACLDGHFDLILMDCHMPDMVSPFLILFVFNLLRLLRAWDWHSKSFIVPCDL